MNAFRSKDDAAAYSVYLQENNQDDNCPFCQIRAGHEQYVTESEHFIIMRNKFPYVTWDDGEVSEHLMIIPKSHFTSLSQLNEHESKEYLMLVSKYESDDFNVYARAAASKARSIKHQHTHFIKLH